MTDCSKVTPCRQKPYRHSNSLFDCTCLSHHCIFFLNLSSYFVTQVNKRSATDTKVFNPVIFRKCVHDHLIPPKSTPLLGPKALYQASLLCNCMQW